MVKRSLVLFLLLVLFALISLTGCWGAREPDEMGYVLAMGIDKGKENIVNVTFQVAIPKSLSGSGGGGGEDETSSIFSVEAASLFSALQLGDAFTSRELTLIHNRVVIVSEEIGRQGLNAYINPLIRSREIRRNTFIMVTRGDAREFIEKNKPFIEKYPSRQFELLMNSAYLTGFSLNSILNEFNEGMKSPGREAVAILVNVNEGREGRETERSTEEKVHYETAYLAGNIPRQGGNKIDAIGLAAFRGEKLAGYLNGSETRYYLMVGGGFKSGIFTFPDPQCPENNVVVLELRLGRAPAIQADLSGTRPKVEVDVILEAEIISIQSGINYEMGENKHRLQQYLEDYITHEIKEVIDKCQRDWKSDIFGFGEYTRRYFWTWQDWKNYRWLERFPDAEIDVRTHLAVRRSGLMIRTEPIIIPGEGDGE